MDVAHQILRANGLLRVFEVARVPRLPGRPLDGDEDDGVIVEDNAETFCLIRFDSELLD